MVPKVAEMNFDVNSEDPTSGKRVPAVTKPAPSVAETPDANSEDETSGCEITQLTLCSSRLAKYKLENGPSVMSGSINRVMHTAASTVGDGACGLHALFGVPQKQELRADNVRSRVWEALPSDLGSLRGDLCEEVRDYLNCMLDSIWEEAKAAASNRVQMQEPRSESSLALCFFMDRSLLSAVEA